MIDRLYEEGEELEPLSADEREFGYRAADNWDDELPAPVWEANEKLRAAADILCLTFYQDDRVLFLGDLVDADIGRAIRYLEGRERTTFTVVVTSHHGTRWHAALERIDPEWAVSSAGSRSMAHLESGWKDLADLHWVTFVNGEFRSDFDRTIRL